MWRYLTLPRLKASHRSQKGSQALREEGEFRRSQSTEGASGSRGREDGSRKLTAALSGSAGLRVAEDEPFDVYYSPRAFRELREMEDAA